MLFLGDYLVYFCSSQILFGGCIALSTFAASIYLGAFCHATRCPESSNADAGKLETPSVSDGFQYMVYIDALQLYHRDGGESKDDMCAFHILTAR